MNTILLPGPSPMVWPVSGAPAQAVILKSGWVSPLRPWKATCPQAFPSHAGLSLYLADNTASLYQEPRLNSLFTGGRLHPWLQTIPGAPSPASEPSWASVLIAVWEFCYVHALKACRVWVFNLFPPHPLRASDQESRAVVSSQPWMSRSHLQRLF